MIPGVIPNGLLLHASGGGAAPVTPVVGTYRASALTSSITGVSIGTAAEDRLVVIVAYVLATSAQPTLTGTIGGVKASRVGGIKTTGQNVYFDTAIFARFVPTGTTVDCSVASTGGTTNRIAMAVWTIDNCQSLYPDSTNGKTDYGNTKPFTMPLDILKDDSFTLQYNQTYHGTSATATATWDSGTSRFVSVQSSTSNVSGADSVDDISTKTISVNPTGAGAINGGALVAAAWGAMSQKAPVSEQLLGHVGLFSSPALATYSMPSVTIPASEKTIYMLVGAGVDGASGIVFSSVTWNSIVGTSLIQAISSNYYRAGLFLFAIPPRESATTADIICNYSGQGTGGQNKTIAAWILPDLMTTVPTDAKGANANGTGTALSVSLTTTANDIAVAYEFNGFTTAGNGSVTWSGVTEDFDVTESTSVAMHSGGRQNYNTAGAKTISCTPSKTASGRALVAVSFPLAA